MEYPILIMMCNPKQNNIEFPKHVEDNAAELIAVDFQNDVDDPANELIIPQFIHSQTALGTFMFCDIYTIYDFFLELENNLIDEDDSDIVDGYFIGMTDLDVYKFLSTLFWDGILPHVMTLPLRFARIIYDGDDVAVNINSEWSIMQRLLMLAGDVESNPGPVLNLEIVLRRKIESLERARLRQEQKNKTLVRKLRQECKSKQFKFQMNGFVDVAKDVANSMMNPATYRAAGYAAANIIAPGSGTAAATVVEGGRILKKIETASTSIDELARSCADHIPRAFENHSNLTNIASMTLDTINKVTERMSSDNGVLSRIEKLISTVTSQISGVGLIISILVILICLSMDWKIACAVIIVVLIYFKWPQVVLDKVKSILFGFKFQIDISENTFGLVGQVLFTLLAFFGVSKIPTDKFYDGIIKRLDSIPKAFSGASKIWDAAGKTFEYVKDEFRIYFLGIKREDLLLQQGVAGEVSTWVERVRFYSQAGQKNDIAKNTTSVREVEALFYQMYRWKHTTSVWRSMPLECQRIISSLTPDMKELYKLACRSTVHEGGPRKKPLGIFLSGDSGCGKSELLVPLYTTLLAHRNPEYCKNINNEVYVRNYETEYWDGYVGQKVCVFDDAFQMKDTPGNPSPEFMESIRLLNSAPAHVHCADLNDKGRFFSSEVCIYTTNLNYNFSNFIKSVNCPEAAIRRLNMCAYRIEIDPAFTRNVNVNGRDERRLDVNLVRNCEACRIFREEKKMLSIPFCAHVQRFVPYDMFTDEIVGESLSYGQLVVHLKREDSRLLETEASRMQMNDELAKDPTMFDFKFQSKDDEEFTDAFDHTEIRHGAIDLSVPTDLVAYQTLVTYLRCLERHRNVSEDQLLADLAAHPQLFSVYQRRIHCGIVNENILDDSLAVALERANIHYNYDATLWYSMNHLRNISQRIYASFCQWMTSLASQLDAIWQQCGVLEIMGLVYVGICMISILGMASLMFKAYKCPVCQCVNDTCVCIRWSPEGLWFQNQLFSVGEDFNLESSSNTAPLTTRAFRMEFKDRTVGLESHGAKMNVTGMIFKTENSSAPVQPKTQSFKVENSSAPVGINTPNVMFKVETNSSAPPQPKTNNFKVEQNQVSLIDIDVVMDQYVREGGTEEGRIEFQNAIQHLQNKQIALNEVLKTIPTVNLSTDFVPELYKDRGCEAIESSLVRKSMYALHSEQTVFGNVIFIKGTTFLMNYHFIPLLTSRHPLTMKMFCTNASGVQIEFTLQHLVENHIQLEKSGRLVDAVLVSLPVKTSKVHVHPDVTRHFIQANDLQMLNGSYQAQLPSYAGRQTDMLYPNLRSLMDVKMHMNEECVADGGFRMAVNHNWSYFGSTTDGDCGGPLIINNAYSIRKVLGIHMASREQSNGSQGLAQTITQEMLNAGFAKLPFEFQCYSEIDIPLEEIPLTETIAGSVPLEAGLMVHGLTDKPLKSGGNTKLQPSVLFDVVPHYTKPAMLRPRNGLDPMHKGLLKFGKNVPRLDPKMVDICANDVDNNLRLNASHRDVSLYKRVLTYEEAVKGVEDDEFLAPINRSTSMGYPYTVLFDNLNGKRRAFGKDDEWTLDSEMAQEVKKRADALETDCIAGIQRGVYWSDTLKDERRDIPKVDAGKTRVFCGGPAHFTIKFRQYFLGFAAWIMHNRNANEISTGTNVYSHDWDSIVRKLASRGASVKNKKLLLRVIAGDFGNFDGSLNAQILWRMLDMINDWYDDGDHNKRLRRGLWMHIVHAVHINGNVVYQSTHSQPSGCPITAILNSIYNSIIVRMVYLICAMWHRDSTGEDYVSLEKFNQFVAMVSYGDDNIIAIAEKILLWFNQIKVTTAFETIGHEYTDEAKTGFIVPVRDITEVAYLKRKFVWDDSASRYIAPLDLKVIMEIVQWTKKGLAADSITLANIDVAMRELSLHEQSVFDENSKLIKDMCIEKNVPYRFMTFYEYRDTVLNIPFVCEMRQCDEHYDQTFRLVKCAKPMPVNFIKMDKKSKRLYVNQYDETILIPKLQLFCAYRNIKVTTQDDILRSIVTKLTC